jgi:hypothetical protein
MSTTIHFEDVNWYLSRNEARFLLLRIPTTLLSDPQLANAAKLVRAVYTRNYSAVYCALSNPTWSAIAIPVRDRIQDGFKETTFVLLSKAYTSIGPTVTGLLLGVNLSNDDTANDVITDKWDGSSNRELLKPAVQDGSEVFAMSQNDERIGRLTGLVTHMVDS